MPWCEECSKYMAPSALKTDGTCPSCNRPVDTPQASDAETVRTEKAPWHFKLMIVALVAYLVWRFADILL